MIGFLEARKGHYNFLNSHMDIIAEARIKVGIIGEGPERDRLERFIHESNLKQLIFLLGNREDYGSFMSSAKVIVHPSVGSEDMPLVIIEALARGCVILSSKVAGLSQYLTDGVNAVFLTETPDFYSLLNDESYRLFLSDNAINLYSTTFSKQKYVRRWIEVIEGRT